MREFDGKYIPEYDVTSSNNKAVLSEQWGHTVHYDIYDIWPRT